MVVPSFRTRLRRRLVALATACACGLAAGAAAAHDYVVVASTEPAVARGSGVSAGQLLAVTPGHAVTLMHANGDLLTLRGAPGGVQAPKRQAGEADTVRLDVLRTLVTARQESREGLGANGRRTRGGVCPAPEALLSLDAIAQSAQSGCSSAAGRAMENWLSARIIPEP